MTPETKAKWKRRLLKALIVIVVIGSPLASFAYYKFFRDVPQPEWVTSDPEMNFLYGSIGSEGAAGIPYWLVVVAPRVFGNYLPGPGGYASLGLPWEEGREFPVGFSKKTVGFERVGFNCALCHATQYRIEPNETPTIVAAGGSHTADIQALLEFFSKAARDPRWNAETLLTEIDLTTQLSWIDRLLYKFLFIPMTASQLIEQGQDFGWADSRPRWGPGRDAPMNLTKFNFLQMPDDGSVDNTDFPSIWNLQVRVQEGRVWPEDDYALVADFAALGIPQSRLMLMNLAGDTTSYRSVLIDSAMGLQAQPSPFFHQRMADLEQWLLELPPPAYPLSIDAELAARGGQVFEIECADCHAPNRDNRLGTVIPLAEINTSADRTNAWTLDAANGANEIVADFGVGRTPMSKPDDPGYIAIQLSGLWLRAPYLHNGSVPTLRALLEPPECRPPTFYRGYDVLDGENVGFISQRCGDPPVAVAPGCDPVVVQSGCMPEHEGWLLDTSEAGNGNGGHDFGTGLTLEEKRALLEFLKTQ